MGDGSQLLQVDQSGVMYNNIVPLGQLRFFLFLFLNVNRDAHNRQNFIWP
jgi:hypothetical protein